MNSEKIMPLSGIILIATAYYLTKETNMRKGTTHSEETKAKISAAKAGKLFTEEHSQKIAAALKGHKKTAEHKQAISDGIKAAHAARAAAASAVAPVLESTSM